MCDSLRRGVRVHRREAVVGGCAVALVGVALYVCVESARRARATHRLQGATTKFHHEFKDDLTDIAIRANQLASANRSAEVLVSLAADMSSIEVEGSRFARRFEGARRRSPRLRECTSKWERVVERYEETAVFMATVLGSLRGVPPGEGYVDAVLAVTADPETVSGERRGLDKALFRFKDCIEAVGDDADATVVVIAVAAVAAALLCAVASLVLRSRVSATEAELEAQEKLARQEAHEAKNKFAPAIRCMQAFVEAAGLEEYEGLKEDASASLALLREVEAQHQARLDCYKILLGAYAVKDEIFDLRVFLRERLQSERAIARAYAAHSAVSFELEVTPPEFGRRDSLDVETDAYVLAHVVNNCLSNSRKHTYAGAIRLAFEGPDDEGRLVFAVRDEGVGVPESARRRLFAGGVTSRDTRGSGLGLPSCALFCEAVGGYIRLVDSRVQDAEGRGGFSHFQFAVRGRVLEEAARGGDHHEPDPPETTGLPDNVRVVVVDDSAINRRCLRDSIDKARGLARARDWSFDEFETVEAAKPLLADLAHDPLVVVTLDENLQSRGGALTGTHAVKWLAEIRFRGLIVSASGDPAAADLHLQLGAHLSWGKPVPRPRQAKADLERCFAAQSSPPQRPSSASRHDDLKDASPP